LSWSFKAKADQYWGMISHLVMEIHS